LSVARNLPTILSARRALVRARAKRVSSRQVTPNARPYAAATDLSPDPEESDNYVAI